MIRAATAMVTMAALAMALGACGEPGAPSAQPSGGTANTADPSQTPGSQSPSTSNAGSEDARTSTNPPATSLAGGGPGRCTASALRGTVRPKDSAAGNRYAELLVTNTGTAPCTLRGYGGLGLVDPAGAALPSKTARDEKPGPSLVTVAPGRTAGKLLHWGVVPTGDEPADRPCQPTAAQLTVIPPDETQAFTVAWDFGPVCAGGTFHDSAYYRP